MQTKRLQLEIPIEENVCPVGFAVSKKHVYISKFNAMMQFCRTTGCLEKVWHMRTQGAIGNVAIGLRRNNYVFAANDHFVDMFREDGSFIKFVCEVEVNSIAVSDTNLFVSAHPGCLRIFDLSGALQRIIQKDYRDHTTMAWHFWHRLFATRNELYAICQGSQEDGVVEVVSTTDATFLRKFSLSSCAAYWRICVDAAGGLHIPRSHCFSLRKKNAFTHWCPEGQKRMEDNDHNDAKDDAGSADEDRDQWWIIRKTAFDSHSATAAVLSCNRKLSRNFENPTYDKVLFVSL